MAAIRAQQGVTGDTSVALPRVSPQDYKPRNALLLSIDRHEGDARRVPLLQACRVEMTADFAELQQINAANKLPDYTAVKAPVPGAKGAP